MALKCLCRPFPDPHQLVRLPGEKEEPSFSQQEPWSSGRRLLGTISLEKQCLLQPINLRSAQILEGWAAAQRQAASEDFLSSPPCPVPLSPRGNQGTAALPVSHSSVSDVLSLVLHELVVNSSPGRGVWAFSFLLICWCCHAPSLVNVSVSFPVYPPALFIHSFIH